MAQTACLAGVLRFRRRRHTDDVRCSMRRRGAQQYRVRLLFAPDGCGARRINDSYEAGVEIGAGAFGTVQRRVHRQTGEARAVKCIALGSVWQGRQQSEREARLVQGELQALIRLNHPNVVRFREWFEERGRIYFVTELCDGGSLDGYLHETCEAQSAERRFGGETRMQSLFQQLAYAVSYVHSMGVCHGDLKPANVLLNGHGANLQVKLIDFGFATLCNAKPRGSDGSTPDGTMEYMAPELFLGGPAGDRCDVWALGIIFAQMITSLHRGEYLHPFLEDRTSEPAQAYLGLFRAYRDAEPWDRELFSGAPASAFVLADAIFVESGARPSAAELLRAEWLTGGAGRSPSCEDRTDSCCTAHLLQHGGALQNFKSWADLSEFDRTVLSLVASSAESSDVGVEMLVRAFEFLDKDSDGRLSRSELQVGFRAAKHSLLEGQLDDILSSMGLGQTGHVDIGEWLAATMGASHLKSKRALDAAFHSLDLSRKGAIGFEDLSRTLGEEAAGNVSPTGSPVNRQDFEDLVHRFVTNRL